MNERLDKLVKTFYETKKHADLLKNEVEMQNKEIKKIMNEEGITDYENEFYKVNYVVQHRESLNEEKLLDIAKNNSLNIIKTIEIVDMEALESMLYNNELSKDIVEQIASCKEVKEVPTLKVKEK